MLIYNFPKAIFFSKNTFETALSELETHKKTGIITNSKYINSDYIKQIKIALKNLNIPYNCFINYNNLDSAFYKQILVIGDDFVMSDFFNYLNKTKSEVFDSVAIIPLEYNSSVYYIDIFKKPDKVNINSKKILILDEELFARKSQYKRLIKGIEDILRNITKI